MLLTAATEMFAGLLGEQTARTAALGGRRSVGYDDLYRCIRSSDQMAFLRDAFRAPDPAEQSAAEGGRPKRKGSAAGEGKEGDGADKESSTAPEPGCVPAAGGGGCRAPASRCLTAPSLSTPCAVRGSVGGDEGAGSSRTRARTRAVSLASSPSARPALQPRQAEVAPGVLGRPRRGRSPRAEQTQSPREGRGVKPRKKRKRRALSNRVCATQQPSPCRGLPLLFPHASCCFLLLRVLAGHIDELLEAPPRRGDVELR